MQLLTDSKALFNVISNGLRTYEKRKMLDIAATLEGFHDRVISDISFGRSSANFPDGLKRPVAQQELRDVVASGHLFFKPEQFFLRSEIMQGSLFQRS